MGEHGGRRRRPPRQPRPAVTEQDPALRAAETFAVYADWRTSQPIHDSALASASRSFRIEDESVCVWVSERDPSVLAFSVAVAAETLEEAANIGRSYFEDGALPMVVPGRLVRVVAMDDEHRYVWHDSP